DAASRAAAVHPPTRAGRRMLPALPTGMLAVAVFIAHVSSIHPKGALARLDMLICGGSVTSTICWQQLDHLASLPMRNSVSRLAISPRKADASLFRWIYDEIRTAIIDGKLE